MKTIVLLSIFLLSSFFLVAQDPHAIIVLQNEKELLEIGKQVFLLEDKEGKLTIEDIQLPEYQKLFKKSEQEIPNFNTTPSKIWVKFTLQNQTHEKVYVEIAQALAWYIDFYKPDSTGKLSLVTETGMMRPIQNREVANNFFLFELSSTTAPQTYYFAIQSEFPLTIPLLLGTAKNILEYRYSAILFLGMFSGLFLVMFAYNLFIYFSVRDKIYLYYCGYLLSGVFILNSISGNYGYQWNIMSYFPNYLITFSMIGAVFNVPFLLKILGTKRQQRFFKIMMFIFTIYVIIGIHNLITGHYILTVDIFQLLSLLSHFFIFFYSIYQYRKGNKMAIFVATSFSFYSVGVIIFILQNFSVLPTNFFTLNSVVLGSSLEVLMFSFALANRINTVRKEKEASQNALLTQIQINEKLVREQNLVLEKTIAEKTKEIQQQNEELLTSEEELKQNLDNLYSTQEILIQTQSQAVSRSRFLEAIAKTNTYLLEENNWQDALMKGFEVIGKTIDVDRVYYFEKVESTDENIITVSQKLEWVAEGITSEINNPELQNIPLSIFGELTSLVLENQIFAQSISKITNVNLKELLVKQHILAIITVPIFVETQFWGFIGFDDCKQEREISSEEINILQTLASNLATTIQHKQSEQKLIENKTKLQSVLNEVQDVIWAVSMPDFKMLLVTPSVVDIYGYSVEEWLADSSIWQKAIHPEDQDIIAKIFTDLQTQGFFEYEYRIITTKGQIKWVRNKAKFILNENQQPIRLDGIVVDITEQKLAENRLKLLQSLVDDSTDAMQVATEDGTFFYLNNVAAKCLGINQTEIHKYKVQDIEKIFATEGAWEQHVAKLKKLESMRVEGENINQTTGHHFPVEVSVNYVKIDNQGFVIANSRDITERKKVEAQILQQQENLLRVGQIAKVGGWEYDVIFNKITWDKIIYDIHELPYSFEPTVESGVNFYKEGESRRKLTEAIGLALQQGTTYDLELELITATGKERWVRALGMADFVNGVCIKLFGVFQDITEHKLAEEQIKKQNEELQNYNNELQKTHEEIANLNNHLENLVVQRTLKLTESYQKLNDYAFFNSHQLRAPIATILGLYELLKLDVSIIEKEVIFEKIQIAVVLLDEMVKKSQSLLHEDE
jgi:PAS domain S-box-containing protein